MKGSGLAGQREPIGSRANSTRSTEGLADSLAQWLELSRSFTNKERDSLWREGVPRHQGCKQELKDLLGGLQEASGLEAGIGCSQEPFRPESPWLVSVSG